MGVSPRRAGELWSGKVTEFVMQGSLRGRRIAIMRDVREAEHSNWVLWVREEERGQICKLFWLLVVSTALNATKKQMDPALPACDLSSLTLCTCI